MTAAPVREKHYGPVDATFAPDCHRYVSRRTYYHVFVRLGAGVAFVGSWYSISAGSRPSGAYWPIVIFGVVFGLAGLWAAYFSTWQRSVLIFTPDKTVLHLRGFIPVHRSGTWTWKPDELVDITIDTLPMPARTTPLLRSSVKLAFTGDEEWRSTFFTFDSFDEAKALTQDIVASANDMIDRYRAQAKRDNLGESPST